MRKTMRAITSWRFTVEFRALGWSAAGATLEELESFGTSGSPMLEAMLALFQARRACHLRELDEASRLALLTHALIQRAGSRLEDVVFCVSVADLLLEAGRVQDTRPLLDQVRALIDRAPIYSCWRAALEFLEARAAHAEGDRVKLLTALHTALELGQAGSGRYYLRFCDQAMLQLFPVALAVGFQVDLVLNLIRMFRLKPPRGASPEWPWPVCVVALGKFEVQVYGKPLAFSRKLPRKTLLLLKAIVAYGGRNVPEQGLCDALWGDEEGDAARNALAVSIVRLRKLLESSDAVIQQGGKVALNPDLCHLDTWAFEAQVLNDAPVRDILNAYGGVLLPDEESEPWSVAPRERLRGRFIDAISTHSASLEEEDDMQGAVRCYLRGIDTDPIVEIFHQGLMRCYERMGRRTESLSAYRRLKQTLSVLLGVPPSENSQRLFNDMLRRQAEEGSAPGAVKPN